MRPEAKQYQVLVGGKALTFETGKLAAQAGGAVSVQLDESVVFAAATMSDEPREGINFFPLTVNFEARMYAGGNIPGGFFRREGRPGENATLISRLIDRPIRPLFPKDMLNAVQVILYSLSSDGKQPLDVLGINAASASLAISDIPFAGPIAGIRVGRIDGEFVANPTYQELEESDLDLVMAASRDAILTVESSSKEVSEETILGALEFGHLAVQPIIDLIERMAREMCISHAHFIIKVKNLTDQKPHNLLKSYRLKRAKQLLRQNEISISEVAYSVGYDNPSSFTRAFKAMYKQSPTEYMEISNSPMD